MHHVFIISTLTFIQGQTDLNHEINKVSIISETVHAIDIKFAVKIVRLKVYYNLFSVDDLALLSRSQRRLKRNKC